MNKITYDTAYAPYHDMTFILKSEVNDDGEELTAEVIGFYYGEPDENATEIAINEIVNEGKNWLKAEFVF